MILAFSDREKVTLQKLDYYSNMNISFLRELVEGINLSFRFHGDKNKEDLLKILQRKLDAEKMDFVFKMYLVCREARDVVQVIKPKGMCEIVEATKVFFEGSEFLHEVTVGSRRSDLVFFSGNDINAVEVKSSLDKISSALAQVKYYKKWANRVYLAYDIKHKEKVESLPFKEKGIGLLQFSDGTIQLITDAVFQELDKVSLLSLMTYNYQRKIAKRFKLGLKGRKQTIAKRVSIHLTNDEAKNLFQDFLKSRALI